MLRPDWPYMGQSTILSYLRDANSNSLLSHISLFPTKVHRFFFLLQECKHDKHSISLVANGQELTHLCSFCIHSIQACCPFCEGLFSRLACDTQRPWLKGFSWASQTLSLRSQGAHQLTNPMQIQRILIFTF